MKKVRLTMGTRDRLMSLAQTLLKCAPETEAETITYEAAAAAVWTELTNKFSQKDMLILQRYDVAYRDGCVRFDCDGRVDQFVFHLDTDAPLTPRRFNCKIQIFSSATATLVRAHIEARNAHKAAINDRMKDYHALIYGSTYLEDVIAVWPPAERERPRLTGTVVVGMDPAAVARIRADIETVRA